MDFDDAAGVRGGEEGGLRVAGFLWGNHRRPADRMGFILFVEERDHASANEEYRGDLS